MVTKNGINGIKLSHLAILLVRHVNNWRIELIIMSIIYLGTPEQAKLLIGGETCLWSEYVDANNIGTNIFKIRINCECIIYFLFERIKIMAKS